MVTMLHYDAVLTPTTAQLGIKDVKPKGPTPTRAQNESQHLAYLDLHPYAKVDETEMNAAKEMLKQEMEVVKQGMGHGDLSLEAYTQVWTECLAQVLHN